MSSIPVVLYPSKSPVVRTNTRKMVLAGTVEAASEGVCYRYQVLEGGASAQEESFTAYTTEGVSSPEPASFSETRAWSLDLRALPAFLPGQKMVLDVVSLGSSAGGESLPLRYEVHLAEFDEVSITAPVPTGIRVNRSSSEIEVGVHELTEGAYEGTFVGFNFYVSTEEGGGASGYTRANRDYVSVPSREVSASFPAGNSVVEVDGVRVETVVTTVASSPLYTFSLTKSVLSQLVSEGGLPNTAYTENSIFYLVATSMVYDTTTGEMVESSYSPEVSATYLSFSPEFAELPPRYREDIALSLCKRVAALNRKANYLAGNVYRDVVDPVAEEFANAYIVQDFISRSQSVDGLLQFDDADGDGVSDPVSSSLGKKRLQLALSLSSGDLVQSLVDSGFDKLASNNSLSRMQSTYSTGYAVFYVTDVPAAGLTIDEGAVVAAPSSGSVIKFRTTSSHTLYYSERGSYYNARLKRYEVVCAAEAEETGTRGNIGVGALSIVQSGADSRWKVTNTAPFFGGSAKESNRSLANRIRHAASGKDTGSVGGYTLGALGVPGVKFVRTAGAGDELMHRDYDAAAGMHRGGKVDIYVQGSRTCQWQDIFAFSYGGPSGNGSGERFFIEDAEALLIKTESAAVTVNTPIFEVVRVTNQTRGQSYDLAGALVGLGDGDSIMLAQNSTNLSIGMASSDIIEADYRYRGYNSYVLAHQPVEAIVSITGDVDGVLPSDNFRLVRLESPLATGRSTSARDGVELVYSGGLPTASTAQVQGEQLVLTRGVGATLSKRGVDLDTLVLYSTADRQEAYVRGLDYKVVRGGDHGDSVVELMQASRIRSGSIVYAWYRASQNFTVVYNCNRVLEDVLSAVSAGQHACADVAVKAAIGNQVDLSLVVTRKAGASEASVASKVTARLASFIYNLSIGQGLALDDVVNLVKNTDGVKKVHLPLLRMRKANGSFILNDAIGYTDFTAYSQESAAGVVSYISTQPVLSYGTVEGGGPDNEYRAILEDGVELQTASSPSSVSGGTGRGYIRSDGRIIVSTRDGQPPHAKSYAASYLTYVPSEEDFAADIEVEDMEYLTIGAGSITVDASTEDTRSR